MDDGLSTIAAAGTANFTGGEKMISMLMAALGGGLYDLTGAIPEVRGYATRTSEGVMAVFDLLHEWLGFVAAGQAILVAAWHRRRWAVIRVSANTAEAYDPPSVWRRYGIWCVPFSLDGDCWYYVVSEYQAQWACESLQRAAAGKAPRAWRDRERRR